MIADRTEAGAPVKSNKCSIPGCGHALSMHAETRFLSFDEARAARIYAAIRPFVAAEVAAERQRIADDLHDRAQSFTNQNTWSIAARQTYLDAAREVRSAT